MEYSVSIDAIGCGLLLLLIISVGAASSLMSAKPRKRGAEMVRGE